MTTPLDYIPESAEEAAVILAAMPRWDHITEVLEPEDTWEHGFCDTHLCYGDCATVAGAECGGLCFRWHSTLEHDSKYIHLSHERESEYVILDLEKVKKNGYSKVITASLDFNDLLALQLAVDMAVKRLKHWDPTFDWSTGK